MARANRPLRPCQYLCAGTNLSRRFFCAITFLLLAASWPAYAQSVNRAALRKDAYVSQASHVAGNGYYAIVVEGTLGRGVGLFAVRTDTLHPLTKTTARRDTTIKCDTTAMVRCDTTIKTIITKAAFEDLIVGGNKGLPGTSYMTIRSYRPHGNYKYTDYVQSEFAVQEDAAAQRIVWLDSLFINSRGVFTDYLRPIPDTGEKPTGIRITYSLPGLPRDDSEAEIVDEMEITQIVNVHGKTFDDSWVQVATIVKNKDVEPVSIGIRYLWDVSVAGDDGPRFTIFHAGDFDSTESSHTRIIFPFFLLTANDRSRTPPPAYEIYGSALTPALLHRAPFLPTRIQQVSWSRAFFKAFDYQINATRDVTTEKDSLAGPSGGDNAIQYFWGEQPNTLTVWPGQSIEVSQSLFAGPVGHAPADPVDWEPPVCEIIAREAGPPKSVELMAQDPNSGLFSIRFHDEQNVEIETPDFEFATLDSVRMIARAIDQTQPFGFNMEVKDVCGRISTRELLFVTLSSANPASELTLTPGAAKRYLHVNNYGLHRIDMALNDRNFTLAAENEVKAEHRNLYKMPQSQNGMIIDLRRHLKAAGNVMKISYAGPPNSRADLILADAPATKGAGVELNLTPVPQSFALAQNSPNPFNGKTQIRFQVPGALGEKQEVTLRIYNVLGQLVRTLVQGQLPADTHLIEWDGRDEFGHEAAAGIYLLRLSAGRTEIVKKMARVR